MTLAFEKARAKYHRAALATDKPWETYRKARERLARRKGQFSAEQAFIDAGQAVARAQERLVSAEHKLRCAAVAEARAERANLSVGKTGARAEEILTAAKIS